MSRPVGRMAADHRVRRACVTLAVGAVALCAAGTADANIWLLGAGAWLLIAAVLLELVYRP
ncbi:hypothetical protein ABT160_29115 [Streptomyces sp. NPDC001941]|uniref:hypothetical protein n=1 Tax=Streptomyces sp. NPDC001941 TaxID=3154659 RepID=UPI0033238065